MDAVTGASSVLPAAPRENRQDKKHVLAKSTARSVNPLPRFINIDEHSTTPGSRRCKHCLNLFSTNRTFRAHINRFHTKDVLLMCNDIGCGYQSFSFTAICAHDRRYHNNKHFFSVGYRKSELIPYQPIKYEIVPLSEVLAGRYRWPPGDNRQGGRCSSGPDLGCVNTVSIPPRSYYLENINCSPQPARGAQSIDYSCVDVGDNQASASNGSDLAQVQRPENIDWTPLSPESDQRARSAGKACPGIEPTGDFRDIYHIFKLKLDTLQPDPSRYV